MSKMKRKEREKTIKTYAEHFHFGGAFDENFKEFNKTLFENTGIRTRKRKVEKLLGY